MGKDGVIFEGVSNSKLTSDYVIPHFAKIKFEDRVKQLEEILLAREEAAISQD